MHCTGLHVYIPRRTHARTRCYTTLPKSRILARFSTVFGAGPTVQTRLPHRRATELADHLAAQLARAQNGQKSALKVVSIR